MSAAIDSSARSAVVAQTSVEPMLTVDEMARVLKVKPRFVRERWRALGGYRLPSSDGPRKPSDKGGERLRFVLSETLARLDARQASERSEDPTTPAPVPRRAPRRRASKGPSADLLPIRPPIGADHA
ncbi:MAG TPA: hypothetical protein VK538_12485 [Solirubrobacteraceae bacterium]|nr:hypothetical protein [Solirubrobacteraceae bacterium]